MPKKSSKNNTLEITFDNNEQNEEQEWKEGKNLDPRELIYKRPDIYVGSVRTKERDDWIFENNKIIYKKIMGNEGLEHLFYELYANIIDNITRSKEKGLKLTKAKFRFSETEISVWNDGYCIPFGKYRDSKTKKLTDMYNIQAAFHLINTSSNYDDTITRKTIGKNGVGAKATNVLSKKFTVRSYDKNQDILYEQTFEENMTIVGDPVITKNPTLKKDEKNGFTEIIYTADFERFGVKKYNKDMINLFRKYIYDFTMNTCIPCYIDKEKILVNFTEYVRLYPNLEDTKEIMILKTDDSEVIITPSFNEEFDCISFCNGGYTKENGSHCENWIETVMRPLVIAINNKGKRKPKDDEKKKKKEKKEKKKEKYKVNIKDVKKYFTFFIKVEVDKPEYEGQSKHKLTYPDVKGDISEKEVKKLMKWEFVKKIEDYIKMKEFAELKKVEKKRVHVANESYDKANLAGKSRDTILLIVEGLSAKEMINHGIRVGLFDKKGRDYIGIFCVQGKILNCRGCTPAQIMKNKTITQLIHALGLKFDTDYTDDDNFKTLMYGKVVVAVDSDVDGSHILSLIQNFFDVLFPTLLKREYLYSMKTPIVKINLPKNLLLYYNSANAKRFITDKKINKKWIQYAKGLGFWSPEEVPLIFGKNIVKFNSDKNYKITMDDAFNSKKSDRRKEMIAEFKVKENEGCDIENETGKEYKKILEWDIDISKFINTELVNFFIEDCKRMIPNLYDGLKESQRKILFLLFKRKLYHNKKEIKVSQLAGAVAEKTSYHHGENNLHDNIARLCQTFVGSNNVNLLMGLGQFGGRYTGQPAQSRYIFTKLSKLTQYIFREEDFNIIKYLEDEGESIEPEFYMPIVPPLLFNGCRAGIGAGYSCTVPSYNPVDVVNWIKAWLNADKFDEIKEEKNDEDDTIFFKDTPDLLPWYRGFIGTIGIDEKGKIYSRGNIDEIKTGVYKVTEIPVGMFIESFKNKLDEMQANKEIKTFKNNSSEKDENSIDFTIHEIEDGMKPSIKTLGLESKISTSNMTLFTKNYKIHQYKNVDDILDEFCRTRYEFYTKRKNYMLKDLNEQLKYVSNRYRFAKEVKDDELVLKGRNKKDVIKEMEEKGYDKKLEVKKKVGDEEEKEEKESSRMGYAYLFNMKIISVTNELLAKLLKEKGNIEDKITELKNTTEKEMWMRELDEFLVEYNKVYSEKKRDGKKDRKKNKK
jgi:DNA topoisomerase II